MYQLTHFGQKINLNVCLLGFVFRIAGLDLDKSGPPQKCSEWRGTCVRCSRRRMWLEGVFCANYYYSLNGYPPCRSMWCGVCYISPKTPHFPLMTLKQLQSNLEKEKSDRLTQAWKKLHQKPNSFLHGRDGDHLMVPFECDLCIFRKLKGHNPGLKNETDSLLLACIRRANLDAFWSSASSTVEGNMRKTKLALNFSSRLGLKGPYS